MNEKYAMEIVNNLLIGLQRARSVTRENQEIEDVNGDKLSPEMVNWVLEDLLPWMHGEKGEALLNAVVKVSERGSVTGGELYNFMTIIHLLSPAVNACVGALTTYDFPKPNLEWFKELGM